MSTRPAVALVLCFTLYPAGAGGQEAGVAPAAAATEEIPYLALDAGGHTSRVSDVVFAPNGREYATCSADRTIRIWDAATGDPLRVLRPPVWDLEVGKVAAVDYSPDGRLLAAGGNGMPLDESSSRPIYLFDVDSGELIRALAGHGDMVDSVRFSSDGKRLLSSGNDHTAKIWDVATGALLQTFTGHTGRIFEAAWSPDERRCATASLDGTARVWSTSDGRHLATFSGHKQELLTIDWSPDGRWIATGGLDEAVRVWTPDGRPYKAFSASVEGTVGTVRFARDSVRLLATHNDRLNQAAPVATIIDIQSGTRKICFNGHTDTALAAAWSPDNQLAATVNGSDGAVLVWQTSDGSLVSRGQSRGRPLYAAAWSANSQQIAWGQTLTADSMIEANRLERSFDLSRLELGTAVTPATGGNWQIGQVQRGGLKLTRSGNAAVAVERLGQLQSTLQASNEFRRRYSTVRCAALLPRNLAVVGSQMEFCLFQVESGAHLGTLTGHVGEVFAASPSPDGRYLLSASSDMTLCVWDLTTASDLGALATGGIGAALRVTPEGSQVNSLTKDGPAEKDGRLKPGDLLTAIGNSAAVLEPIAGWDLTRIVGRIRGPAGTSVFLRVQRDGHAAPEVIELVRESVTISNHIYPLLQLFFAGDDWIVWTPQGYYAASPGGERLIGWHVNNGWDRTASYYPASQFRKRFYRPDVIRLLLTHGSVAKVLEHLGESAQPVTIASSLPPKVQIVSPESRDTIVDGTQLNVQVRAEQTGDNPVVSIQLLLNGRPLTNKEGTYRPAEPRKSLTHTFTVPLTPGAAHVFQARADNAVSHALSDPVQVTARTAVATAQPDVAVVDADAVSSASLYVLAVGISQYQADGLRLSFAADDARRLAEALTQHGGRLFRKVEVKLLADSDATQRGILTGLAWLRQQMTHQDVGVLFYSGHGTRDEAGVFYFLPVDYDAAVPLLVSGVSEGQFKQTVQSTPGKLLVLLDACHAGVIGGDTRKAVESVTDDFVRDLSTDDYGAIIMCSSMAREVSVESALHSSGCFTQAVIEGLGGKADANADAHVYLTELDAYVSDRVKELTQGRQHPVTAKPASIRPFPLSRLAP